VILRGVPSDDSPPSPIELLLPAGGAKAVMVLGAGCPTSLAPAVTLQGSEDTEVDLVILAPSQEEERDGAWIEEAAELTARCLAGNGFAYVLPARARRLRRALESLGLRVAEILLHVPNVQRSRHIVATDTAALRYLLSGSVAMSRGKRLAAATLLRSQRLAAFGPTGAVVRRAASPPLAAWLFELDGAAAGSTLMSIGTTSGAAVLFRFTGEEARPDAVAKVSRLAPTETDALRVVAPTAAQAGVVVPRVLASAPLGETRVLLQSALLGQTAAELLTERRLSPGRLQERLATWLARWGQLSGRERLLRRDDLERLVLAPAARLLLGESAYAAYLSELCEAAEGTVCRFVASHGDLTAANILLDESTKLGIVDWQEASEEALPLVDFFYAAADAVAAVGRYADRPGSVFSCFAPDGKFTAEVGALVRQLGETLRVAPALSELCFHACWLQHARNEVSRGQEGPFRAITEMIARDSERFWRRGNP
jgi:aminoglycoside phosphotransferase